MEPQQPEVPGEVLDRYAVAAPRYTSYPTALDWEDELDSGSYRSLLAGRRGRPDPLGVYVHVPFCEERCLFCGCNVVVTRDRERSERYVDLLEREISAVADSGVGGSPVTQYHWGGGTPTYLSPGAMERLHAAFSRSFRLEPGAEAAVEVDPRVTTEEQLALLASMGFNRISLGVQDFDPVVQKAVKRVQSVEQTRHVIEAARGLGFQSVNVDLIYGLPRQTLEGFRRTLDEILDIRPERIALFLYAHVPWIKKHHRAIDLEAVPSREEKLAIFTDAVGVLTGEDYVYLGLDHFALPGDELAVAHRRRTLQRNFMGYSTRAGHDLLGFGVSAIGMVGGAYVQNERDPALWRERIRTEGTAVVRGHRLRAEDHLRRDVIERLMCHGVVVKQEIADRHGVDFDRVFALELEELRVHAGDGLVRLLPESVQVTPRGQLFLRNIALVFDSYRRRAGSEGSRAFSRTI